MRLDWLVQPLQPAMTAHGHSKRPCLLACCLSLTLSLGDTTVCSSCLFLHARDHP